MVSLRLLAPLVPCLLVPLLLAPTCEAQDGTGATQATGVTSPLGFFGKQIGADHFLANYTQLRGYWKRLAGESDRMQLAEIGTTSYGQPMLLAVISAPENLARLEHFRGISGRLALARGLDDAGARELARAGKAVVWIDAGMHATESVAGQNIIELVYRMLSGQDRETLEILADVILLVCPANPDGMELVANAYMATGSLRGLPVLYQKYIGHDNNRDHYMSSMRETEVITFQLYRHWFPQIVYNHHQSAPQGTVIFTPPFRDPFNYNFDPMLVRGISLVANHINSRFSWQGQPGVISGSGARYSTWWNGGLRTTAYFHNMIGILTESFGSPTPTRLTQSLDRRLPHNDYPDPVASGMWHARQTIEYLQTSNRAILLLAARYREDLLYNIYQMGRNSIRRGSSDHWTASPKLLEEATRRRDAARIGGTAAAAQQAVEDAFRDPKLRDARAYLIEPRQLDPAAVRRFVGILIKSGVEVHRLGDEAVVARKTYPKGTFVVLAAQAFRPQIRDMFEPQWHPDDVGAGGSPVRPYDSAGWTPVMQMGVEFDRVFEAVPVTGNDAVSLSPVTLEDAETPPPGQVSAGRAGYLLDCGDSGSFAALNRLLAAGQRVYGLRRDATYGRRVFAKGSFYFPRQERTAERLGEVARELGLSFFGVDRPPGGPAVRLAPVRVGLFDVYGGDMATGWARWLLEQARFDVKPVFGDAVHAGDLRARYDVLVFFTGLPDPGGRGRTQRALRRGRPGQVGDQDLEKLRAALPPFEDWSNLASRRVRLSREKALPELRRFLTEGGVIVTVASQAQAAARLFELPLWDGVLVPDPETGRDREATSSEFFIPGSLLRLAVVPNSMAVTGLPTDLVGMFRRGCTVFRLRDSTAVRAILQFPHEGDLLASGWAIGSDKLHGRAAAVQASIGAGQLFLFGTDVTYRGQPSATIKMFLNSILLGGAPTVPTIEVK